MVSFIPRRLELPGYPELNCFPLNTLLTSYGIQEDKPVLGSVIYEPDFSTFRQIEGRKTLVYKNIYNPEYYLLYLYEEATGQYYCAKFNNQECLGEVVGSENEWHAFCVHVGLFGLAKGEKCNIEYVGKDCD